MLVIQWDTSQFHVNTGISKSAWSTNEGANLYGVRIPAKFLPSLGASHASI